MKRPDTIKIYLVDEKRTENFGTDLTENNCQLQFPRLQQEYYLRIADNRSGNSKAVPLSSMSAGRKTCLGVEAIIRFLTKATVSSGPGVLTILLSCEGTERQTSEKQN